MDQGKTNHIDENEQALGFFNENQKLRDLMMKAMNYSIEILSGGAALNAFLMTEKGFYEPVTGNQEDDLNLIKSYMLSLKDQQFVTYSVAGSLSAPSHIDWQTQQAIFVHGLDNKLGKGILLVQMYRPKDASQEFALLGDGMVQYSN